MYEIISEINARDISADIKALKAVEAPVAW